MATDRKKLFARFRTQEQVDAERDRLYRLGDRAAEQRDRCEFESADYWCHHDRAVTYWSRGDELGPKGSAWPTA
jgi:glutamate synthase domain-containing protein 1